MVNCMIAIYGIRNCDTVRKALKWAEEQGIEFSFHDFRKNPVSEEVVERWNNAVGRDKLVNKRGTTYRKLNDDQKVALEGAAPYNFLANEPTLMKRPVFEVGDAVLVGFTETEKSALLKLLK